MSGQVQDFIINLIETEPNCSVENFRVFFQAAIGRPPTSKESETFLQLSGREGSVNFPSSTSDFYPSPSYASSSPSSSSSSSSSSTSSSSSSSSSNYEPLADVRYPNNPSFSTSFKITANGYILLGTILFLFAIVWKAGFTSLFDSLWPFLLVASIVIFTLGLFSLCVYYNSYEGSKEHNVVVGIGFVVGAILLVMAVVMMFYEGCQYTYIEAVIKINFDTVINTLLVHFSSYILDIRGYTSGLGFTIFFLIAMTVFFLVTLVHGISGIKDGKFWVQVFIIGPFALTAASGTFVIFSCILLNYRVDSPLSDVVTKNVYSYVLAATFIIYGAIVVYCAYLIRSHPCCAGSCLCSNLCVDCRTCLAPYNNCRCCECGELCCCSNCDCDRGDCDCKCPQCRCECDCSLCVACFRCGEDCCLCLEECCKHSERFILYVLLGLMGAGICFWGIYVAAADANRWPFVNPCIAPDKLNLYDNDEGHGNNIASASGFASASAATRPRVASPRSRLASPSLLPLSPPVPPTTLTNTHTATNSEILLTNNPSPTSTTVTATLSNVDGDGDSNRDEEGVPEKKPEGEEKSPENVWTMNTNGMTCQMLANSVKNYSRTIDRPSDIKAAAERWTEAAYKAAWAMHTIAPWLLIYPLLGTGVSWSVFLVYLIVEWCVNSRWIANCCECFWGSIGRCCQFVVCCGCCD